MTAFSRTSGQTPWGEITCELRSVNHRYLEINPRLPDEVRSLEPQIRDRIAQHVKRGRVDCNIRLQQQELGAEDVNVNTDLVAKVITVADQIHAQNSNLQPLRVVDVLRWPGVVLAPQFDEDQVGTVAMECLEDAIHQLVDIRRREGERLLSALLVKLEGAREIVDGLKNAVPDWQQQFRQRVEKRLEDAQVELDPSRLEQELVIYIQKSDVSEEIDRLDAHLEELSSVFQQDQPIGRRLDFLMQELNREANTLGSKSIDTRLTQASVELKVLIEQMREQVQNLE
ncbi:MAG: YicC/YloC family endoribonuclease [Arenicellales bacterium]|nr:YicC/YloC family endoribonuclease [Arenicellales bacterium]